MKYRLGVVIAILATGLWFFFDKSEEKSQTAAENQPSYLRFIEVSRAELFPSHSEPRLEIVKICQGEMGEELGYVRPIPKTIVFFKSPDGTPEIITARVRQLESGQRHAREIQTQNVRDLNHFLLSQSGIAAEHGQLVTLREIDSEKGSSRYEALMAEATSLCTSAFEDWTQRDLEMEALRNQIESEASAYVAIEWPLNEEESSLEIFFEINGRPQKAEFLTELFRI
jgi:hypothetical protein